MSASSVILTLFASLPTDEQAETLKSLIDLLASSSPSAGKKGAAKKVAAVKSSAVASAGKAKASTTPSAKREPRAWDQEVQAVREEYGVEGDEEGNALTLPNGEYKYVMSWKDAMVEASARRKAALAAAPAAPVKKAAASASVVTPLAKKPAAAAAVAAPKKVAAAAVEEEAELEFFEHEDKSYLLACDGAAWHLEDDGSKGAWAGYFGEDGFDTTRPDPSV
jgi:hypothetical protein